MAGSGQTEEEPNSIMVLSVKPFFAWMVVAGAEIREPPVEKMGTPSPSPIRWVLGGKIHGVEITIGLDVLGGSAPVAGSRMVDGLFWKALPLFHGVVPGAHVMLTPVVPGKPRASMTAAE